MAETFEFGVGDLFSELFAHALGVFVSYKFARAISARSF